METTELRFELRGACGTVTVRYGVNEDPRRWGYDVLGLPYDFERSRGFPVVEATVEPLWRCAPAFFDAPSTTSPEAAFRADAFLAVSPTAVMTPVAEPLCGFSWGCDVVGGVPVATPLTPAGVERWAAMRPVLEAACPGWTFR